MPISSVFHPGQMTGNRATIGAREILVASADHPMEEAMSAEIETSGPAPNNQERPEVATHSHSNLSEAMSSFLVQLVHEFRNHLGTIRNTVEMIRVAGEDPATLSWSVGVLDRQAEQMSRLVEDTLDLALSGQGRLALRCERVDLGTLLTGVVESVRAVIETPNHRLVVELPTFPLTIDADPVRLRQVLVNLITNSAKYTNPGGTIVLRATSQDQDVILSVRDDGIGIEPEALPHVFDLFWQSRDAVDRAQGGHGIGLSLVRQIVELHGGRIAVTSEGRGRGSEFQIHLPSDVSRDGRASPPP
jgi:signal transduction histidine kinase